MSARRLQLLDPWGGEIPRNGGAVVVDLFRATSTLQILVDHGCTVRLEADPSSCGGPAAGVDLRVGEWRGEVPPGMDCGNSPVEVQALGPTGATVEFVSSNGAGAILGAAGAARVVCASLFNEQAVRDLIVASDVADWSLVPAGCRGERRIEDDYVCARLARALGREGFALSPRLEALVRDVAGSSEARLRSGPSARFLRDHDCSEDIEFILRSGYRSDAVPVLEGRSLRAVRGRGR